MKEQFTTYKVSGKVLMLIEAANVIMGEYAKQGFVMTLRMVHYQFVARQLFANTLKNYKKLGWALRVGRRMGLVDWAYLEDQVRKLDELPTWDSPRNVLDSAAVWYKENIWEDQEYAPEVWVEKGAMLSVIRPVCTDLRLPALACRGYVSDSAQYEASKRFITSIENGKTPIVFYLGDHDPSGLDMTRDNIETFEMMTGEPIEVRRLALNWDQIEKYGPPPNPAKMTDTRAPAYVRQYGRQSWEVDALPPNIIDALIREAVTPLIEQRKWKRSIAHETANRNRVKLVADNAELVIRRLERAAERGLI